MGSQEEAMKELIHGRDSVAELASLLQIGSTEGRLIEEVMSSINKAMAALNSGEKMEVNRVDCPSCCVTSNKESVGGKRSKMQSTRRAGYRRRGSPYLWTRTTSCTLEDEHTWRKYGQKEIFGAKYPRSYFRCTHKFDQSCKATKQVQRSEDDPSKFVITYFGEHTCGDATKTVTPSREPCIISFESSNGGNMKQETLSSFRSLNQESEEEVLSNPTSADSTSDYFVSPNEEVKKYAQEQAAAGLGQEHNGLTSALYSSFSSYLSGYGMEFMDSYEDFLNFGHSDLFQD